MKKVSIIDYGMGNVQSLKNIFDILNCDDNSNFK